MKTNFFRSTVLLVLILIIPMIYSGIHKIKSHNSNKPEWQYLVAFSGVILLILFCLIGFSLLIYSFFLSNRPKKPVDL